MMRAMSGRHRLMAGVIAAVIGLVGIAVLGAYRLMTRPSDIIWTAVLAFFLGSQCLAALRQARTFLALALLRQPIQPVSPCQPPRCLARRRLHRGAFSAPLCVHSSAVGRCSGHRSTPSPTGSAAR